MKRKFSAVTPFFSEGLERYSTGLGRNQLYPEKNELELTYRILMELDYQLKSKRRPTKEISLFGRWFALDEREQEELSGIVKQFIKPYQAMVSSYKSAEERIASEMKLQVYYGFVNKEGKLIPRDKATFVFPILGKFFTYQVDTRGVEITSQPLSLETIVGQSMENNDPIFAGGQAQDLIYVECSDKLPLVPTLIPIALKLYQNIVAKK